MKESRLAVTKPRSFTTVIGGSGSNCKATIDRCFCFAWSASTVDVLLGDKSGRCAHQSLRIAAKSISTSTKQVGDTILPMEVQKECMVATYEKQPLSATSNMVYCKRLTIVLA